ncbi:MAG: hypothetical protein DRH17_05820 [Deltaproteobacteria bacterium]|nr:MAG: hypothetical protein DRH17_05820 [Deltaproteobacteria bacterium]
MTEIFTDGNALICIFDQPSCPNAKHGRKAKHPPCWQRQRKLKETTSSADDLLDAGLMENLSYILNRMEEAV